MPHTLQNPAVGSGARHRRRLGSPRFSGCGVLPHL